MNFTILKCVYTHTHTDGGVHKRASTIVDTPSYVIVDFKIKYFIRLANTLISLRILKVTRVYLSLIHI